jgi:hypothetical protein
VYRGRPELIDHILGSDHAAVIATFNL